MRALRAIQSLFSVHGVLLIRERGPAAAAAAMYNARAHGARGTLPRAPVPAGALLHVLRALSLGTGTVTESLDSTLTQRQC